MENNETVDLKLWKWQNDKWLIDEQKKRGNRGFRHVKNEWIDQDIIIRLRLHTMNASSIYLIYELRSLNEWINKDSLVKGVHDWLKKDNCKNKLKMKVD